MKRVLQINMSEAELIEVLKKTAVKFRIPRRFPPALIRYKWSNFKDPANLKLLDEGWGPLNNFIRCKGTITSANEKSTFTIQFKPSYFVLILFAIITAFVVYAITQFGMYNYGKPGFYISILFPAFAISIIYLVWFSMFRQSAKRLFDSIEESIEDQTATYTLI